MANVPLTGSQSLFVREGHIFGGRNQLDTFRGSTMSTRTNTIYADYTTTNQSVVQGIYAAQDTFRQACDPQALYYQTISQNTLIQMVNDSDPLNPLDLPTAIATLSEQMISTTSGLQRPTVTASVTANSSNYGDAVLVASTTMANGRTMDYVFTENITAIVTNDSGLGATAYQEPVQITGDVAVDSTAWNWPQGSGANNQLNIADGGGDTLVLNGGFETWPNPSTTMATNWEIVTGTINVGVIRNGTVGIPLVGNYCCQMVGNGGAERSIKQLLTGLLPGTSYAVCIWYRLGPTVTNASVDFSLIDQDDTVIENAQGIQQTYGIGGLSSGSLGNWTALRTFFQTPLTLPDETYLFIDVGNLATGEIIYLDNVGMALGNQVYAGGPFINVFAGGTPSQLGDRWTIAVSNSGGVTTFCRSCDRDWNLRNQGLFLPSITVGYIPDSLIT